MAPGRQDHYQLRTNPTAGAMGYHYFNRQLMADLTVDPWSPRHSSTHQETDGELRLVAVEWVARGPKTNPPGLTAPPSVLGMPMHILDPAVGFYIMHAWIWEPNPAGMFTDWNPRRHLPVGHSRGRRSSRAPPSAQHGG